MNDDRFTEARLGFTLCKPAGWQFAPPAWSPSRELATEADAAATWSQFGHLPFCSALKPHASRQHAFATLQVSARPLAAPGPGEAAAMLQTVQGIVMNQNPATRILEASSSAEVAGYRTNLLRCRFAVPVEVAQQRVMMGVLSRSYVIFTPTLAFTVGLTSSDDPQYYDEREFAAIVASIGISVP